MFWWVFLKFIIFLYVNLYQFEFQKSFIRLNLLVLPIFLIFKHTFSNYCYVYLFFFYNMNKFECSAYFYILVKTYIFQSLLSNFFFRETIIKKVITLEGQFPNCFYSLCSLIFQSVCLNTGLCHGNFLIGLNCCPGHTFIWLCVLSSSRLPPAFHGLKWSITNVCDLLRLSGCSVQERWELNFFSLLVSIF